MSRPYAEVIGDPIAHSKSPLIHEFWLKKLGIDAEFRACRVQADDLANFFAKRRDDGDWCGCNVTIPHKEKVHTYLDEMDDRATAVGAVNAVYRSDIGLIGTNSDVDGVNDALSGLELSGQHACVIGAGGAARAAFAALARTRVAKVQVFARNPEKAIKVANAFDMSATVVQFKPGSAALCDAMLLINATQLGMVGQDPLPGFIFQELVQMAQGARVFDMVYAPLETDLLAAARRNGIDTVDGLTMLVGQAAVAFEKFFGQSAPREYDAELRQLLTA